MAASNKVDLVAGTQKCTVDIDHAERILNMPKNGGWELPEDSKFKTKDTEGVISLVKKGKASSSED